MATHETLAAILAIVLVIGVAGSGLFSGAATVSPLAFSIKPVQFPASLVKNMPFKAVATFSNSGTISASQVTYDLRVWKNDAIRGRTEAFRSVQRDSKVLAMPAGAQISWELVPVDLVSGTYVFQL